ncbi:MAG: tetratricopeptide repeat protein [Planctomycetaceae bacterium]|nr:tetratricopeptide repeat protein [Planctomycetaceae bacterium]
MSLSLSVHSAQAGHWHVGVQTYARPHCVTDYYGWHAPLTGFDSSFFLSSGGYYRSSFSSVRYSPWGWAPTVYPVYPGVVVQQTIVPIQATIAIADPPVARTRVVVTDPFPPKQPNVFDVAQQHAQRRANIPVPPDDETVIRTVSSSSRVARERSQQYQTEGDRWLREGQNVKAYLRYLEAQREAEDRGEVYFRQAFVLVAMGRYSHAVSKLKRGLQVDPKYAQTGPTLDNVYGVENVEQKVDYLQRVADWANADVRDPDRLFLMGVMLHFDEDSRAAEFLAAAGKLEGRGQHIQAFLKNPGVPPKEARAIPAANRRPLPPPPPPQDDLTIKVERRQPQPVPQNDARGPRLPVLKIPPEPAQRVLILPDVYLPEENR